MCSRIGSLRGFSRRIIVAALAYTAIVTTAAQADPLASWNDGPAKQAIVAFVKKTTTGGRPQFVPPDERIVAFRLESQ